MLLRASLRALHISAAATGSLRASPRLLHFSAASTARYSTSSSDGFTTKAMGKKKCYAVAVGRRPGVYKSWDQCVAQVRGFPGNNYKGFDSEQAALSYLQQLGVSVQQAAPTAAGPGGGEAAPAAAAEAAQAAAALPASASTAAGEAAAVTRKRRAPSGATAAKRQATAAAAAAAAAAPAHPLPPTGRVLRLEFDGASKRNPGPAGWGAVLFDDATGVEVARLCQYMGDYHTNNQAEYAGLIAGLHAALALGCRRIKVLGDSTLIIRQVLGQWQVKNEELQRYHAAASGLRRRFDSFEARQVLRQFNKVADALSNQAIDDYRSGVNRQLWSLDSFVAAGEAAEADEAAAAADDEWEVSRGGGAGTTDGKVAAEAAGEIGTEVVPAAEAEAEAGTTAAQAAAAAGAKDTNAATEAAGGAVGGGEGEEAGAGDESSDGGGVVQPAKRARQAA